jgi:hypothetical protein
VDALGQHIGSDYGIFTLVVYHGRIVAHAFNAAFLVEHDAIGKQPYKAKFAQGAYLCPFCLILV